MFGFFSAYVIAILLMKKIMNNGMYLSQNVLVLREIC